MPEMIMDGKGRSYLLEVGSDARGKVEAVTILQESHVGFENGLAFQLAVGTEPLDAVDTTNWNLVIDLINVDPTRNLIMSNLTVSWNGGNTTGNKVVWARVKAGYTITGNYTPGILTNLNQTSANIALATFNIWDGVGSGITHTGGGSTTPFALAQGRTEVRLYNTLILGLSGFLGLEVKPEEAGRLALGGLIFFKDR